MDFIPDESAINTEAIEVRIMLFVQLLGSCSCSNVLPC